MICPSCGTDETRTLETRTYGAVVMRKRRCDACSVDWPTQEVSCGAPVQRKPTALAKTTGSTPVVYPQSTGSPFSSDLGSGDLVPSGPSQQSEEISERDGRKPNALESIVGVFGAVWGAAYGEKYMATPADKSQLGRVLRGFPSAADIAAFPWREVFRNYLADRSRWASHEHRHSLRNFCNGGVNKYRTRAATEGMSDKEIRGTVAAERFVSGK